MDFCDYVEFDHWSYRNDVDYLDRLSESYGGSPSWTQEEKVAWCRRQALEAMPILPDESEAEDDIIAGPTVRRWVKRGHIMRFHQEEFFEMLVAPIRADSDLPDADAIAYYLDDGSGNPMREYYGHFVPEGMTVFTSDVCEE